VIVGVLVLTQIEGGIKAVLGGPTNKRRCATKHQLSDAYLIELARTRIDGIIGG
jgi:hypothetical protein